MDQEDVQSTKVFLLLQVLKHLGEMGPYQRTLYLMLCIPACLPAAFLAFNQVYKNFFQLELGYMLKVKWRTSSTFVRNSIKVKVNSLAGFSIGRAVPLV